MRFVLQRVKNACVTVDGNVTGKINLGYLLFVGVSENDSFEIADKMIEKVSKLRIFEDEKGKTNLSISDVGGEILIVSQFTLYADCRKGNRPSFILAANPEKAEQIYEYILDKSKLLFKNVEHGIFGADMKIELLNDGPFTLVLDSEEIVK